MIYSESAITDFSYPVDETLAAIRRRDVMGTIGCMQNQFMKIVATGPHIFDVQTNVVDHLLAILRNESIRIDAAQVRTIRELSQTVYHGMCGGIFHGVDLRSSAIKRLTREGSLWLQQILTGAEEPRAPGRETPLGPPIKSEMANGRIPPQAPRFEPSFVIEIASPSKTADTGNGTSPKQSTDSPDCFPTIPTGFRAKWQNKEWQTFCLRYGYDPKTNTFDPKKATSKKDIATKLEGSRLANITSYNVCIGLNTVNGAVTRLKEFFTIFFMILQPLKQP